LVLTVSYANPFGDANLVVEHPLLEVVKFGCPTTKLADGLLENEDAPWNPNTRLNP